MKALKALVVLMVCLGFGYSVSAVRVVAVPKDNWEVTCEYDGAGNLTKKTCKSTGDEKCECPT